MQLYPYQIDGARFLAGRLRGYLADGMGLGKTVQTAVAAKDARVGKVLVLAPASAVENWKREWAVWGEGRLTVMSWASPKLAQTHGSDFDLVVLDEAHYAKNPAAKRTKHALRIASEAPRSWLLSGTPMPNNLLELYAPLAALWPEIPAQLGLKSYSAWRDHFCVWTMGDYGPRIHAAKNTADLKPHLKRIMLRRRLEDISLEMPPLRVDVSLLPRDAGFARELEVAGVDAGRLADAIEAEEGEDGSASRLRRLLGQYKAPLIAKQIAEELDNGEYRQIVVLAYHRDVLEILRHALKDFGVVGFDGSTSQVKRQAAIDAFTQGRARVFVAQQSAAGIAINLQSASEIVLVEPAWSPDDNRQAIKRVHRIGSKNPVRARLFAVAGSLDEAVMGSLVKKIRMQEAVGL